MIQEEANSASDPPRASDARVPEVAPDARVAAKESAPHASTLSRHDDQFFEELTRTNNDLANLQRDLARKNAELAAAQRKLRASEQRYLGLSACSPIGILEMDLVGGCLYSNPHWHSFTGLDAGESQATGWQRVLDPCEAPDFLQSWRKAVAEGGGVGREVRLFTASGEARWAHFRSRPIRAENGAVVGHVSTVEDITERRLREAALAEANKQMVDISRLAGMAEVATGVLHNVGNVLNSVNVSANLLGDQVRKTPVADLNRVVTLLREQGANLGEFFTSDPRGPKVREFLAQVAETFTRQQESQLTEVESLQKNIEHIKDIVAMQQSFAKVSGLNEHLSPVGLIEDAVRMNAGSFQKHEVNVVCEMAADLPQVCVDKHKVLQILINLLRNAKHACDDAGREDKRITVRATHEHDRVRITVIDNGVGIPPENLNRIFNHGFTTKKEGHGFGLHSAANAAKEMGGALTARSDGLGTGATFTLELPVQAQRAAGLSATVQTNARTGLSSKAPDTKTILDA